MHETVETNEVPLILLPCYSNQKAKFNVICMAEKTEEWLKN